MHSDAVVHRLTAILSSDAVGYSRGKAPSLGLPFRSFLRGNLVGAVLFVPYAVGIGYAIGYGLGPYVAHVQQELGGLGSVVLLLAITVVIVLAAWPMIIRIIRRSVMFAMRTRPPGRTRL